ncbi:MAG: hypothetical protein QOI00_338 [Chloroflexota bacterium]|nr:hypothetical protein [Chloroflexota bacterium]MEA2620855.1 hypothetical protein [Chloroflexota bacterium]
MSNTSQADLIADQPRPALDSARIQAGLDHEVRLVMEAILLVSSGGSPRVTVAGLHFGEEVLEASGPNAAARNVRLVALWTDDERGADLVVEALDSGER